MAEANAITDSSASLSAGTILQKPSVASVKNDANSFKPYNPNEIVGSTTPSLPYVPPAPCNPMMIIVIIVMIIVTIYTAGAAAGAMGGTGTLTTATVGGTATGAGVTGAVTTGTLTAGSAGAGAMGGALLSGGTVAGITTAQAIGAVFVGGVAGSIAGQVVGNALGVSQGFSLRQAFAGGITSVLTAGIAGALGGTTGTLMKEAGSAGSWGKVAASALGNAAAGYVGNRIAGVNDTSFSWKAIAAGAVTNIVTAAIGNGLNKLGLENSPIWGEGQFAGNFARNAIGGVVSLHVRRAFGFDDRVDYGSIAADAFGNAFASEMVKRDGVQKAAKQERFNQIGHMLTGALGGFAFDPENVEWAVDNFGVTDAFTTDHIGEDFDSVYLHDSAGMHRDAGARSGGGFDNQGISFDPLNYESSDEPFWKSYEYSAFDDEDRDLMYRGTLKEMTHLNVQEGLNPIIWGAFAYDEKDLRDIGKYGSKIGDGSFTSDGITLDRAHGFADVDNVVFSGKTRVWLDGDYYNINETIDRLQLHVAAATGLTGESPTFTDLFTPKFMAEFKKNSPFEHEIFLEYGKTIDVGSWSTNEFERRVSFEKAWKEFTPYAEKVLIEWKGGGYGPSDLGDSGREFTATALEETRNAGRVLGKGLGAFNVLKDIIDIAGGPKKSYAMRTLGLGRDYSKPEQPFMMPVINDINFRYLAPKYISKIKY